MLNKLNFIHNSYTGCVANLQEEQQKLMVSNKKISEHFPLTAADPITLVTMVDVSFGSP